MATGILFGSQRKTVADSELKVIIYQNQAEIPVGGRLRFFRDNWEKITDDQWVLSVIAEGYKLEFLEMPFWTGIRKTSVSLKDSDILIQEINTLIEKDAIEPVRQQDAATGFYSTFFLVPKKNGTMRPVINLRPLNRYLKKIHFKMDTLTKVLNLVKIGDWAISLDLSDAYLHIPIFQKHRKFLRFSVQNRCYQWKVLCFGPTSAPRVFTKMVSVVAAFLRTQNVRLVVYLDDWLVVNQSKNQLYQDRKKCLDLLNSLGFLINREKSSLVPTQNLIYLGGQFHLDKGLVCPTQERIDKLNMAILILSSGNAVSAFHFLQLLGIMASCIELIPNARLFMRPVQLHLLSFWRPSCQDLSIKIPVTPHLKSHLSWWKDSANTLRGQYFQLAQTSVTITTDASKTGYGGFMNNQIFQGEWSEMQSKKHINSLELEAVFLTLKHFLNQLKGQYVLIRSDNTTVVQYINKQGGTKSPTLCYQTWDLWNLAIQNNIRMKAAHITGKLNILADQLSRTKIQHTEWSLNKLVVQNLFQIWGTPLIDLFASIDNRQTEIFCSWIPHQKALALDALTISWERMYAYAYPPICLIPKVLQYMRQYQCQILLIAPQWPRRHWYPELLQLLIAVPIRIPVIPELLCQPKTRIYHPNPQVFKLTAWLLSTNGLQQKAFLKGLESYSPPHGEKVLKKITAQNSEGSIAGVVQGKLIPIKYL